jgi:hypothetical protein
VWRWIKGRRDLGQEDIVRLLLDGTVVKMRFAKNGGQVFALLALANLHPARRKPACA